MTDPRWLDERQQCAWRSYLAMHTQLTARLHRRLQEDSGLSLADFDVLVQLTDHPDGRVRILQLARALQWEKSRLSHHLTRMQRRGLITRQECPEDARGAFVVLTPAGRQAIEQAAPQHVETVRDLLFDQLTAEQVDTLHTIAERVLTRLQENTPPTRTT
ncbi:MarR family winged helix-turn-helix transcriptional regulator [Actinomadura alba]|uniref:MarR family transcriptional regulator n=1 Tax=Actinomadura alba TaxID=406431 RepID=A0ABR7LXC5_9ACTN|nr:MarR family transcriptional regulator [Actinomadura alba]MBC6469517.1 MarR family transcriptional regulator [Actinomadura alba]